MIKNGRPYTCEDGDVADQSLITDRASNVIQWVSDWIKNNIVPATNEPSTCDGNYLKRALEDSIGIYLTTNEFKDAMILAGYLPDDANVFDWKFSGIRLKSIMDNHNPFFQWALKYKDDETLNGKFVQTMIHDLKFPVFADHDIIANHLCASTYTQSERFTFQYLWDGYVFQRQGIDSI